MYTLDAEITAWRPGNVAKRVLVGLGSGREASDIQFRVTDGSGKQVLNRKETIRTNFFSQGAGSTGQWRIRLPKRSPIGSRTPSCNRQSALRS